LQFTRAIRSPVKIFTSSGDLAIGRRAIAEHVGRAAVIGISSPIPEEVDHTGWSASICAGRPQPDRSCFRIGHIHAELRRRA